MSHIIQKQILDIRLPKKAGAIEQQEAIRSMYWDRIVPAMDKAFSQIVSNGATLRLGRLSLDIGSVPFEKIEQEIMKQVTEQLAHVFHQSSLAEWTETTERDQSPNQKADRNKVSPKIIPEEQIEVEALLFFLSNGIFPWWFAQNTPKTPAELLQSFSQKKAASFLSLLQKKGTGTIRKRFVGQFQVSQLLQFTEQVFPDLAKTLTMLLELFVSLDTPIKSESISWIRSVNLAVKETILYGLIKLYPDQLLDTNVIRYVIDQMVLQTKIPEPQLHAFILEQVTNKKPDKAKMLRKSLKPKSGILKPISKTGNNQYEKFADIAHDGDVEVKDADTREGDDLSTPKENKEIRKELEEGLFIENAGIVIVAPFLQRYFGNLGLIKDRQFISVEKQERALFLLQHLATGQINRPENELLLNKIITGWSPEEPVQLAVELSEKEKRESDDLLRSLIQHWGALGHSGVDALRETFLLREGKLVDKEDQYQLFVERRSLDLLMDRIPWSFSIVKLPWMEKRIQVEW